MIDINNEYYDEIIEITLDKTNIKHYKMLGYECPTVYDKYKKKNIIKIGTVISVKRRDMPDLFLLNRKFGSLTVIAFDYDKSNVITIAGKIKWWICKCDCGSKSISIKQTDLLHNHITRCFCCGFVSKSKITKPNKEKVIKEKFIPIYHKDKIKDLTGQIFGRLTVISLDEETPQSPTKDGNFRVRWWCKCDCGTSEPKSILGSHLTSGNIQSCGCLHHEACFGENNWNWKGGKTPEIRRLREQEPYLEWRRQILQRDDYACQCCGSTCYLNAHHLYDFAEHENLRYDVNNGIILCEECHAARYEGSFHNVYGTKDNTPDQLREYILNKSNIDIYETHPEILSLTTQN